MEIMITGKSPWMDICNWDVTTYNRKILSKSEVAKPAIDLFKVQLLIRMHI